MEKLIFAQENGRQLNFIDKIFGISGKANEMKQRVGADKVINATVGALIGDDGKLVIFDSVVKALRSLDPADYAQYAPISGVPAFLDVVQKYAFGNHKPNMYTAACATPGGTGAIKLMISNYSKVGDAILTSDWHWAAYDTITTESGRRLETYDLTDENGAHNIKGFEEKVAELLEKQDSLAIMINTPANNPTGFCLTDEDWDGVLEVVNRFGRTGKKITVFVDAAYIDYTKDPDAARAFLKKFEGNCDNVLGLLAYSASKSFAIYGMRCGAVICMTNNEAICAEFKDVANFSSRGTWSNGTRAAQQLLVNMYNDPDLKAAVDKERDASNQMLLRRGRAFEEAAKACGLETVPFDAGFFLAVPCKDSDAVGELMHPDGLFTVPLKKGIRVALAGVTEEQCKVIPGIMKKAMDTFYGK